MIIDDNFYMHKRKNRSILIFQDFSGLSLFPFRINSLSPFWGVTQPRKQKNGAILKIRGAPCFRGEPTIARSGVELPPKMDLSR